MTLSFHIRHEVTPERVKEVFNNLQAGEDPSYVIQSKRQVTRLRKLGLVKGDHLSDTGQAIYSLCASKGEIWEDIMHYLHYTLWKTEQPLENAFSWTYREFSDYLWRMKNFRLDDDFWSTTVIELIGKVEIDSRFVGKIEEETLEGSVSLSKDSLKGAFHWLQKLTPEIIDEDNRFQVRHFCFPQLALLASGWVARMTGGEVGIDLLLTPERREAISKLCLLDPSALDKVLDWMLPIYPEIVLPGTRAGAYGRFIRFRQWPQIEDLVST
jgi:hypothetical protein